MHEPFESADAESKESTAGNAVPDDFPRDPFPAALSGAQLKFAARLIEGRYVVGLTPEERTQRYLGCLDLVDQLTAYVHKKLAQKPDLTLTAVLDNLASRIPQQGWDLGGPELVWIEKHLRARFASH
jgi:hypothetical protein